MSILNINSFFRFLGRNKTYTAIDVFGLSVSLMFVLLIAVYTVQELSVDRQHEHLDRICVVTSDNNPVTGLPIPYWLQERYPEIEKVCPVVTNGIGERMVKWSDRELAASLLFTDSCFFNFFSFELLEGDRSRVLEAENYVVLSRTFANKLFGTANAVGETIQLSDSISLQVMGIMEDITHSTIPERDMLLRVEQAERFNSSISLSSANNAGCTLPFLMLRPGADLSSKTDDILNYFKEHFWLYQRGFAKEVGVLPMRDLYFEGTAQGYSGYNTGDKQFVLILLLVGILVLIFAIFNYINLTVAQAGQRAKEMATRRLLGSTRGELFMRLIEESTVLTLFSFGFGLLFVFIAVPYVNELLDTKLDMWVLLTPAWIGAILAVLVVIGVLAGLLPAMIISSVKPIDVVRGTFRRKTKMVFSKVFITIQNTITITMLGAALVMFLQSMHLINAPLGYNTTNVFEMEAGFKNLGDMHKTVDILKQQPFVKRVGYAAGMPLSGSNNASGDYEGKNLSFQQFRMDSTAFQILGLKIISDNRLAEKSWYLTEKGLRDMELPMDAKVFHVNGKHTMPIAGVVADFKIGNITAGNRPAMVRFEPSQEIYPWSVLIEVTGDPIDAYGKIRAIYEEQITYVDFAGRFLTEQIEESFDSEIRTTKIVSIFAALAILISMLGLLAMSTYFIQQRAHEMAVRKVFGSDNSSVLYSLIGSFLIYVGIAFIIALPIIHYAMGEWLSGYSYRIELSWWMYATAGLLCLFISFVTVFIQSYQASNTNPIEYMRNR